MALAVLQDSDQLPGSQLVPASEKHTLHNWEPAFLGLLGNPALLYSHTPSLLVWDKLVATGAE